MVTTAVAMAMLVDQVIEINTPKALTCMFDIDMHNAYNDCNSWQTNGGIRWRVGVSTNAAYHVGGSYFQLVRLFEHHKWCILAWFRGQAQVL